MAAAARLKVFLESGEGLYGQQSTPPKSIPRISWQTSFYFAAFAFTDRTKPKLKSLNCLAMTKQLFGTLIFDILETPALCKCST